MEPLFFYFRFQRKYIFNRHKVYNISIELFCSTRGRHKHIITESLNFRKLYAQIIDAGVLK